MLLRLKLVKEAEAEIEGVIVEDEEVLHRADILKHLVQPWAMTYQIYYADSYFGSVPATCLLKSIRLSFVGVVKTDTRMYPKKYLSVLELNDREDVRGVILYGERNKDMLTYL